jgi:hypothetical protein
LATAGAASTTDPKEAKKSGGICSFLCCGYCSKDNKDEKNNEANLSRPEKKQSETNVVKKTKKESNTKVGNANAYNKYTEQDLSVLEEEEAVVD